MKRHNGFTLIELMIVIAIIGILAAVIFPPDRKAKREAAAQSAQPVERVCIGSCN